MSKPLDPTLRVTMLPRDTNSHGTIFGGVILSHIDLAGGIAASRQATRKFVTRAMREVEFHEPVFVGDIVNFYTQLVRVGHTSITIRVTVEAERWGVPPMRMGMTGHGELVKVTEAEVILVAVNDQGRPIPIRPESAGHQPPTSNHEPPTTNHHQPPTTNHEP